MNLKVPNFEIPMKNKLGTKGLLAVKLKTLKDTFKSMKGVVVAFSGGVDSTLLLKTACEVLGDKVLAVTGDSETYPSQELTVAKQVAAQLGVKHMVIETEELANENFANNPHNRCYYCKTELFGKLVDIAGQAGYEYVVDGANFDDISDYRPGMVAGAELGVRSPLKEAGLTKADIRTLAQAMGLPNWNKPSFACLSSRFPYGHRITGEKLTQVDKAENYLRNLGFNQLRVRHHENIARIEVLPEDFVLILDPAVLQPLTGYMKSLGFVYVTLDLAGFRSGSMNEVLGEEKKDGLRAVERPFGRG